MIDKSRRGRRLAVAVAATLALGVTAACGSDDSSSRSSSDDSSKGPVTITVQTFGGGKNFGLQEAIEKWNATHTDIKIKHENLTDQFEQIYWPQLIQQLQSGAGAGDVVGIEEGGMGLAKAHPEWWVDLGEYGLTNRQSDFPAWKWENGITTDGKLFALGTDIGGMSLCYRRDLFEKAGLPSDREEVSKLWPTWDDFIEVGKKFQEKIKDTKFVDGTNTLFNVVLVQEAAKHGNVTYFDRNNNLIIDQNPAVKTAFDFAVRISKEGLTAKLRNFTDEWFTGMKKSQFATLGCPSWMLGVVSGDNAAGPELKGKWDVAAVPGGGGNWGGSWLAVPKQTKHPAEAAKVVDYLTSKEAQVSVFTYAGNMPSNIQAQQDPAVQNATNEYFNNAPIGEIFAKSASSLQPVFLGIKHAQVKNAVESVISAIDDGSVPYDQAWEKIVDDAKKAAS
ncbi:ABC transporter substrate-binding protein [Thermobispora bispora]|jgi:cellobiose transport system substrate-binding protein|uniref:ABC transporter substrate-binding protein n=1 Tax=Thermobispora bispora TaxID=2006 RepID=UPI00197FC616|nr:extracellular solute-binding protein [Thermobispora bispora]MBO2474990.1 sugar ABC transporter substrate-binding protein [Actinomycetales bacterium]MBX6167656.1 extracellular solute-binding protein [Thermobispora bispora]MDI9579166.1 extracellular solute-binding protein [Thermobispora sp.]QSI48390.1 extracellular solute-binding protein [Thermobispora bispora]